jgi:hypothetical protein
VLAGVALDVLFAVFALIADENPIVEACAHSLKPGVVGVERDFREMQF